MSCSGDPTGEKSGSSGGDGGFESTAGMAVVEVGASKPSIFWGRKERGRGGRKEY